MTMPTQRQSLEQKRARHAYDSAKTGKSTANEGKAYKSYVKKIPMLIRNNGLIAAFAFVKAKSGTERDKKPYAYHLIYQQTETWLRSQDSPTGMYFNGKPEGQLIENLIGLDSHQEYRHVASEVMALFTWMKRAVDGLIEGEDDET